MPPPAPASVHRIFCRKCDYDLHGLASRQCPECGQDFDPQKPDSYESEPPSWSRWFRRKEKMWFLAIVLIPTFILVLLIPSIWNELHRGVSHQVKGGSSISHLVDGIHQYRKIHHRYPPDLGTLIKEQLAKPEDGLGPRSWNDQLIASIDTLSLEEQASWLNKNSDFMYIPPPPDYSLQKGPDLIIVFEKKVSVWGDFIEVFYASGNIGFATPSEIAQLLQFKPEHIATQPSFPKEFSTK